MKKGFFIAGTDTNIGKTTVACALLRQFKQQGYTTVALKPVAAGCIKTPQGLRNDDALLLQQEMTQQLSYEQINPIALLSPVSPNIAAQEMELTITVQSIVGKCQDALNIPADVIIVEGSGGWESPLNDTETMADLAEAFALPIILVVGIKLGCLNHAMLTYNAIKKRKLKLAGWVANCIEPNMLAAEENISYLKQKISAPLLGKYHNQRNIKQCENCT